VGADDTAEEDEAAVAGAEAVGVEHEAPARERSVATEAAVTVMAVAVAEVRFAATTAMGNQRRAGGLVVVRVVAVEAAVVGTIEKTDLAPAEARVVEDAVLDGTQHRAEAGAAATVVHPQQR
jgi:hypothetical protein